jgi:hypothetical protein
MQQLGVRQAEAILPSCAAEKFDQTDLIFGGLPLLGDYGSCVASPPQVWQVHGGVVIIP